jgi:hypothetical protein
MSENELVMVLYRKMRRRMEDSNFHTPGNAATSKKKQAAQKERNLKGSLKTREFSRHAL